MGKVNAWRESLIEEVYDNFEKKTYGYYTALNELQKIGVSLYEADDNLRAIEEEIINDSK